MRIAAWFKNTFVNNANEKETEMLREMLRPRALLEDAVFGVVCAILFWVVAGIFYGFGWAPLLRGLAFGFFGGMVGHGREIIYRDNPEFL